jgi:hypothetical protein
MNTNQKINDATPRFTMPDQDFLALGTPSLAYVKEVLLEGVVRHGIFSADGRGLGIVPSRELAFAAARQHDLEPVSVH